jgi:hypothetical protein
MGAKTRVQKKIKYFFEKVWRLKKPFYLCSPVQIKRERLVKTGQVL